MKKLNTLFAQQTQDLIDELHGESMNSKSEISRAAVHIGLSMLSEGQGSMTDREFYNYIKEWQTSKPAKGEE